MAEDKVEAREVSWRQLLPWTEIFRGFGVALDLNKLLLAAAGILVMSFGWWLLAIVFGAIADPRQLPQWPGDYLRNASPDQAWSKFESDRKRWNLMHETAGVGNDQEQVYDVADLASTSVEYDKVREAVGEAPYNLGALDRLQMLPTDKGPTAERPLDPAKVRLYKARLGKPKPDGVLARFPFSEDRGVNPYLLVTGQAGIPWEAGHAWEWFSRDQLPVLVEPLVKLMRPLVYFFSPRADDFRTKVYFLSVFVWTVVTWSLFGGAITRIAVVQVARPGEPIGLTEAMRFTYNRLRSYIAAPLFPLVVVFALLFFSVIFGAFHLIPLIGDIFVDGLLWFVMLLVGLVMTLFLVGLAVGWPLMAPTISAEGTDSWEALSRSYSYVFQRPWHYLWYVAVTLAYGAVVIFFVGLMGSMTVYLSKWAVAQTPFTKLANREPSYLFVYAPQSFGWRELLLDEATADKPADAGADAGRESQRVVQDGRINPVAYQNYVKDLNWWNKFGAMLVAFWLGLLFLLILGFGYSFFFSTTSIIYLLMRRNLDAAEMDEVYLEEEDQDGFSSPVAPASPEAIKPSPQLQMVDAPSMRPVAPPTPAAPPAAPSYAPRATTPPAPSSAGIAPAAPAAPPAPLPPSTPTRPPESGPDAPSDGGPSVG
jgi:hypothetical protein